MRIIVRTWHVNWAVLISSASDPEGAEAVHSPALDAATRHDRTRVVIPKGHSAGVDAWGKEVRGNLVRTTTQGQSAVLAHVL